MMKGGENFQSLEIRKDAFSNRWNFLTAAGKNVDPVAMGAGLARLGLLLAHHLAGSSPLQLEGVLVVRDVHGIVVALAIAIFPLQVRMVENGAPITLI